MIDRRRRLNEALATAVCAGAALTAAALAWSALCVAVWATRVAL
ncbi:hypothetical protein [Desertimonas flava]|nr:hypothetical protein [Desertimonas flava]